MLFPLNISLFDIPQERALFMYYFMAIFYSSYIEEDASGVFWCLARETMP